MIQITYIFHSCFCVETAKSVLVFDYWMDPKGVVAQLLKTKTEKRVYVFASHFHEDHFNKAIFEWREVCPNITYILSKDILKHRRAAQADADVWMAKGATWADENIDVVATGSNDSGVSWVVDIEGKRIFHAGDLCNWYARFLAEDDVPERIVNDEGEEVNPVAEEKLFLGELKDIKKVAQEFDLVMFPVDGRIGNGYTLGARQFLERFKVGVFVPMHFVMSGFESAWRMAPFCKEANTQFWGIAAEGERIALEGDMLIRPTNEGDIPRLHDIYSTARSFMAQMGNPNQWAPNYPSEELLKSDIASGDSYVVERAGKVVATFVLRGGDDPTYANIYNGSWLNDMPYATIHRIASSGEVRGLFRLAMEFAIGRYDSVRIDTHHDNRVMQSAILKAGFKYCGIIHCWNGSERLAYQYSKD